MNRELELKLEASLDGELSPRQARRLAARVAHDPEAQALLAELRQTQNLLAGNEQARPVPESREFYWHKIEQAILRAERAGEARAGTPWWLAWRRYLAPAAAVALVTGVTLFTVRMSSPTGPVDTGRFLDVVENLSEHTESFAFRSPSENMFVVWIYSKDEGPPAESESDPLDDMIY